MVVFDLPVEEIQAACEQNLVQRLELFGSAATGRFDPATSDYDFLVTFKPMRLEQRAETFFGMLFALEDLLARKVDLVEKDAIRNPYFLQRVQQSPRKLIYESRTADHSDEPERTCLCSNLCDSIVTASGDAVCTWACKLHTCA